MEEVISKIQIDMLY